MIGQRIKSGRLRRAGRAITGNFLTSVLICLGSMSFTEVQAIELNQCAAQYNSLQSTVLELWGDEGVKKEALEIKETGPVVNIAFINSFSRNEVEDHLQMLSERVSEPEYTSYLKSISNGDDEIIKYYRKKDVLHRCLLNAREKELR